MKYFRHPHTLRQILARRKAGLALQYRHLHSRQALQTPEEYLEAGATAQVLQALECLL